ncbi:hypothetical protein CH330_03470 [candidate division WOR-3 bacterium JGI_Cruoil_03_51_56]|uniref:Secretion system C-terminal sorting domain-containing protein n=1 Tax=candidate division WOR-3 bacterium JGI_Cruoil_03_51_56 TaxID=1973747 RepID=A0A235BVU7_UNCW3|nr:MAG: hypothetical protein CH330_03470 [candidate division WOR-3 bacterium JGI_Cruoil_03_51_56]
MNRIAVPLFLILLVAGTASGWLGPYPLATSPGDDINPSACKEWVQGEHTCLVWQTDSAGNWDVHSRFCGLENGNGWMDELPVASGPLDEIMPAVCAVFDPDTWMPRDEFWCVWERRDTPDYGSIWAARGTADSGWIRLDSLAITSSGPGDTAAPSVISIGGQNRDTVWVVWHDVDTNGHRIDCMFWDGMLWSSRQTIHAEHAPLKHIRVGRRHSWSMGEWPFVVWEKTGDIFFSENRDGFWTQPEQVAPSAAQDREPEIVNLLGGWYATGPWITWTSERDGDTAVFGTAHDTFTIARRWCDTACAGRNWSPCGTVAWFTTDWEPVVTLAVSDRNGNPDIYDCYSEYYDWPVDTHPSIDINPTLTTLGYVDATTLCWACWQSDRSGNWDIYGSFFYNTGVEENGARAGDGLRLPTIVRGVLSLPGAYSVGRNASCSLLDITGRKVMDLKLGENDIRHLSPGVYFVRLDSSSRNICKKVVLQ